MDKYKKLINNSLIFAVGNLGSKLMQFILVPIYSYTLTTSQFGLADFITTIISLISPLICLDMIDGVFRFALDDESDKPKIFSTGMVFTLTISVLVLIISILLSSIKLGYSFFASAILLIATTLFGLVSNYVRAIGYVKVFAIGGVINTIIMGLANILFLVVMHRGVIAYITAIALGQIVSIGYLFWATPIKKQIQLSKFDVVIFKEMCKYSLPLIPNTFAWWLNSASDRFFILLIMGTGANGIYAMVNRFPTMVTTIMNIFSQSWQMSVVEEFDNSDSKKFISNVFEHIVSLLFVFSLLLLIVLKPIIGILLSSEYYNGWKLVPFMLMGSFYMVISSFLGVLYTASKKTEGVFISTVIGAVINIILSLILIKLIGTVGAAIANIISFFVVTIYRYAYIVSLDKIEIKKVKLACLHAVFILLATSLFVTNNLIITGIVGILCIVLQLFIDSDLRKLCINAFNFAIRKVHNKEQT